MPTSIDRVVHTLHSSAREFEADLGDLIRIPSVSSDSRHCADVKRAATHLARHCRGIGFPIVRIIDTGGHPAVVSVWRQPRRPTVLIYGHYDVQPADRARWTVTDPFEPVQRNSWMYGRGSSDDKGQLMAHLAAIGAWARVAGGPPVGIIVVADGEEEIGSPHLAPLISSLAPSIDAAVISDMTMPAIGRPALTETLRGKLSLSVTISNRGVAAHSGLFGGAIADPAALLCAAVAGLHDPAGSVAVNRFYDDVRPPPSGPVRARLDTTISAGAGGASLWPEAGCSADEATTIRPSIVVGNVVGGPVDGSISSIVPASATARLDVRLVADQRPTRISRLICQHIRETTPDEFAVSFEESIGANPARFDRGHPVSRAAIRALTESFGSCPEWIRSGGTIPVASHLAQLGIPSVLVGFGLPSARAHGPDERVHLPTLLAGAEFSARWLSGVGDLPLRSRRHRAGATHRASTRHANPIRKAIR